jgi:hypothetical protein
MTTATDAIANSDNRLIVRVCLPKVWYENSLLRPTQKCALMQSMTLLQVPASSSPMVRGFHASPKHQLATNAGQQWLTGAVTILTTTWAGSHLHPYLHIVANHSRTYLPVTERTLKKTPTVCQTEVGADALFPHELRSGHGQGLMNTHLWCF